MPGKLRIGYVGVGLMGLPMVKRLVSLGYPVRACDIVPEKVAAAAAAGASPASSAADAANGAELVLLNLPTTDAVEQAVFGEVVLPVPSFAIAVTHWLNGVPFWPAMCFLLWFWQ